MATPTTVVSAEPHSRVDIACRALKHLGYAETFVEIAETLNIESNRLNNIRHGIAKISDGEADDLIESICSGFGLTTHDLFDEDVLEEIGWDGMKVDASIGVGGVEEGVAEEGRVEVEDPDPTEPEEGAPLVRGTEVNIEHGDSAVHAGQSPDGVWNVHFTTRDSRVVRLVTRMIYQEIFHDDLHGDVQEEEG